MTEDAPGGRNDGRPSRMACRLPGPGGRLRSQVARFGTQLAQRVPEGKKVGYYGTALPSIHRHNQGVMPYGTIKALWWHGVSCYRS
jgi:hypothetical protein